MAARRLPVFALYERRRVGKSTLLAHFANGKRAIYHLAQETSPKVALEQFSRTVAAFLGVENASFRNWEAAFDAIAKAAKDERLQVLSELLEDSSAFPCAKKHYALFSKSGFTAAVVAAAGEKGIALVGLERLFAE